MFADPTSLLWIIFGIVVVIAGIYTAIFLYHWKTYNIAKGNLSKLTVSVYLSGLVFLLGLSFLSLLAYAA